MQENWKEISILPQPNESWKFGTIATLPLIVGVRESKKKEEHPTDNSGGSITGRR